MSNWRVHRWSMSADLVTSALQALPDRPSSNLSGGAIIEACCLCTHVASRLAVSGSREDSHALHTPLKPEDTVVHQPVPRGGVTVHSQATMHGSGYASAPRISPHIMRGIRHCVVKDT